VAEDDRRELARLAELIDGLAGDVAVRGRERWSGCGHGAAIPLIVDASRYHEDPVAARAVGPV
jgi:hypothetical protein